MTDNRPHTEILTVPGLGIANIEHDCQTVQPWDKFTGKFQSLAREFIRLDR